MHKVINPIHVDRVISAQPINRITSLMHENKSSYPPDEFNNFSSFRATADALGIIGSQKSVPYGVELRNQRNILVLLFAA